MANVASAGDASGAGSYGGDLTREVEARRLAEAAAAQLHRDIRAQFDLVPVGMAQIDIVTRSFSRVNAALCHFLGYSESELIGKTIFEVTHPDDRPRTEAYAEGASRAEIQAPLDKRYVRKDGTVVWGLVRVAGLLDAEGRPAYGLAVVHDITERKAAEAAEQQRERRLRFLAHLGDLARDLDEPADIIARMTRHLGEELGVARCAYAEVSGEASDSGSTITFFPGYEAPGVSPIVGSFPFEAFGPRVVREARAGTTLVVHDVASEIAPHEGGEAILALATRAFVAKPVLKGGRLEGGLFLSHPEPRRWRDEDIDLLETLTEGLWATVARARAEAALRQGEERMRLASDAARVGMWFWDIRADRLVWTPLCRELFALGPDEPLSYARFLACVHPEDRARTEAAVQGSLRERSDYQIEYRVPWPDGSDHHIAATGRCEYAADGAPLRMMGVVTDITRRVQMEAERALLERQLRQSQKMESLGTLAGGIAHDFNNILAAIKGNLQLAAEELTASHPTQELLAEASKGAARAADLVRRILAFARPSPAVRRPLDIRPVVEEAGRLLRSALPAMIVLRTELDPHAPLAFADASEIHQIVMNLGTNARDAMRARRGTLTLGVRAAQADSELCRQVPDLRPGPYVCLWAEDTGDGMDAATLERIYEPFFTTKGVGQGTGLGLSVVHGIVRGHGGAVRVTSRPGEGTTFQIFLPAVASPQSDQPRPSIPEARTVAGGGNQCVLYVDDEASLVTLASRMLRRLGYAATGAASAAEALTRFDADPSAFDLVITDLGMPGMTGIDLTRELLRRRPGLPVVMTTGDLREEDRQAAESVGVSAIILKPHTIEEMERAIAALLSPSRPPERSSEG